MFPYCYMTHCMKGNIRNNSTGRSFGEVRNVNRFVFCAALYVFMNAQIMHAHWLPNAPSLHHEIYIKVHKDQTLAKHLHIHTNRLRDRLEWYSYNQNYIVNKSLQQLLNIHSVVRGEPISTIVWQLKVRRPLRHCVFLVACAEMLEINRTAPAGNDSLDFRRRLNVRRLFMMPCSSGQLAFVLLDLSSAASHRDAGRMISQVSSKLSD